MFLTKRTTNLFKVSNSYGYSCFKHGLNRLWFLNEFLGEIATFRSHSSILKCGAIADVTPLRIRSIDKSFFNFNMKIHMSYGKLCLYNSDIEDSTRAKYTHITANDQSKTLVLEQLYLIINELQYSISHGIRDKNRLLALSKKLDSLDINADVPDLVKLFYLASVLKIGNEALLLKISKKIIASLAEILHPVPLITSYLISMRHLLVRDVESLNQLLMWLCKQEPDLKTITTTVHTLAVLNYFPKKGEILLKKIMRYDINKYSTQSQYFNFVWSLVLIDCAEENMIKNVLNNEFWKKLEYSVSLRMQASYFLKLRNIYSYSRKKQIKIDSDMSWLGSNSVWLSKLKNKKKSHQNSQLLRDLVIYLFPLHTYSLNVISNSGFNIDAVCYLSEECKPTTELKSSVKPGSIKLAISILSFQDYCYPGKVTPTGIIEFHKNLLEWEGYTVLFLNYNYFLGASVLESKCEILEKSIRNILPDFRVE